MEPFKFYWNTFSIKNGLYFIAVVFLLYLISFQIEFPWFVVGLSVVLAWIVILLGKPKTKDKILMAFLYLVSGVGLTFIHSLFVETYWPWLVSIFVVVFVGTYLIKYGTQWYILGWSLILWYLNLPLTSQIASSQDLLISHLLGSTGVLLLVIVSVVWERKQQGESSDSEEQAQPTAAPAESWVISYSLIVATVVLVGLIAGAKYFSDPIVISNAAFMIIGFTGNVVIWKVGIERMIGITAGVVLGFYLGVYAQSPDLGMAVMVICYFLLLATVEVNNGFVMFLLVLTISYGWGLGDFEASNAMANEKLLGELVGVILAGVAIFILNLVDKALQPATE